VRFGSSSRRSSSATSGPRNRRCAKLGHPPTLEDALAYLDLLAELKPAKLEQAAVRWHGRLEAKATFRSLAESQLALAALASLCAGERDAIEMLRRLLRRVRPKGSHRVEPGQASWGGAEAPPRE
jgi:hypothetical protein